MDLTILISVIILICLAVIEIVCLLRQPERTVKSPDFIAVIPVFSEDEHLTLRLNTISEKITRGICRVDLILLVDYGATAEQTELCRHFCRENPCTEIVLPENLEKILSKTFAIEREI